MSPQLNLCLIIRFKLPPYFPFLSKKLDGQVIVITGGNTGLGFCAAKELARRNPAAVILACRNVVAGNEAARQIMKETGHSNVK